MKQFTLGKEERLKSRKLTEQLFREGKKFSQGNIRLFYLLNKNEQPALLFATGASSKSFKRAVDRNRIKRLIRESYRLQKNLLWEKTTEQGKQLILFFLYTGKELPEYKELFLNTGKLLVKLEQLISNKEN